LAAELDSGPPAHATARIANALLDAVAAIEKRVEPAGELDVRALLREVIADRA
jgi:hypothetical protein